MAERRREAGHTSKPDLRGLQETDELVNLLMRDAVHDLALVSDELHDHLGHVDPDTALLQHTTHSHGSLVQDGRLYHSEYNTIVTVTVIDSLARISSTIMWATLIPIPPWVQHTTHSYGSVVQGGYTSVTLTTQGGYTSVTLTTQGGYTSVTLTTQGGYTSVTLTTTQQ